MHLSQRALYMKDSAVEDAARIISATHYDTQILHMLNSETLAPSTESKQNDALAASEEANRIELELIKKEDSDFELTEALFMQSLGLESLSNAHLSRSWAFVLFLFEFHSIFHPIKNLFWRIQILGVDFEQDVFSDYTCRLSRHMIHYVKSSKVE